ncbi:MAG: dihydroorotase [Planctomycetota bacterium]|jgi:dihydroorotase|nr:dihydroorotase [Planctomycetota bacterium]
MSSLVLHNAQVLDPGEGKCFSGSVAVREGLISYFGESRAEAAAAAGSGAPELDAGGLLLTPGLIDMHVHLREPGNEAEETIASGSLAAVAGGFTSIVAMANTDPPVDDESGITFVRREGSRAGYANVFPVGTVTAGREGRELAEMAQMARGGAVAYSDDGSTVPTAGLLRRALSYARMLGKPILEHCEDPSLAAGGTMNEGRMSTRLGLNGIPCESEEIVVARDVAMARLTGGHVHIQHVSTAKAIEVIRRAKSEGVLVTAEVAPHHLALTSEVLRDYDPVYKVSPPLRGRDDVLACRRALADGVIDAVASDHAPHLQGEKELEFAAAPAGMIGLETTLGVVSTVLVKTGLMSWPELIPALTSRPAGILKLQLGRLIPGWPGDLTLIDPERDWLVEVGEFRSRSRNCPFQGWRLTGRAVLTVVGGRVVFDLDGRRAGR